MMAEKCTSGNNGTVTLHVPYFDFRNKQTKIKTVLQHKKKAKKKLVVFKCLLLLLFFIFLNNKIYKY